MSGVMEGGFRIVSTQRNLIPRKIVGQVNDWGLRAEECMRHKGNPFGHELMQD